MDYAELLMEVRQRTGVAGAIERGSYYVANAERMLEKQIKTAAMQTTADLATDADGVATLPSDFLQLTNARDALIFGNQLSTSTPSTTVSISYFSKLPSVEAGGTNWLIDAEPELYLQAVALQVYLGNNKPQEAAATAEIVRGIVEGVNSADIRYRLLNRKIEVGGIQ